MSGRTYPPINTTVVIMLTCAMPSLSNTTLAAGSTASAPPAAAASTVVMDEVLVTSARERRTSKGAINLPLSIADTPQSVTVLDREILDAFAFDSVNDALKMITGVNVEEVETDRTYYNSRGFDIKSMQVDGVGLPFNWNVIGSLDTVIYDKVEVVRGANGLLTGTGNPSGTINYIRKRPTNDAKAYEELTVGSFDKTRLEGDVSGPLTPSGSWAGRVIAARQESDSYLDRNAFDRSVFYGIVDGQVTDNAILTVGYSRQNHHSKGASWGALPLLYANGSQTNFDTDTNTSQDWSDWKTRNETGFIELAYTLSPEWELKTVVTHNKYEEPSELFYVYASPGLDPNTGLGLYGYPGKYYSDSHRTMIDVTLTGTFDMFERSHSIMLGFNKSHAKNEYLEAKAPEDDPSWGALPAFPDWSGREIARPSFGEYEVAGDWTDDVRRIYGAANLQIADPLNLIVGFNTIDVESNGFNFGESMDRNEDKVSPYVGILYHITDWMNAYASYSNIFEPQAQLDINSQPLRAAEGRSSEVGIKAELMDKRLLATASVFKATQNGYASDGIFDADTGRTYYNALDIDSHGYEMELAGRITKQWLITSGFTQVTLEDKDGNDVRTFVPRQTFKLGSIYKPAAIEGLELGGNVRWQDAIKLDTEAGTIRQNGYAVVSAYAAYEFNQHWKVQANANNITDKKYLNSLYWDQAFYGAPSNYSASVKYSF